MFMPEGFMRDCCAAAPPNAFDEAADAFEAEIVTASPIPTSSGVKTMIRSEAEMLLKCPRSA